VNWKFWLSENFTHATIVSTMGRMRLLPSMKPWFLVRWKRWTAAMAAPVRDASRSVGTARGSLAGADVLDHGGDRVCGGGLVTSADALMRQGDRPAIAGDDDVVKLDEVAGNGCTCGNPDCLGERIGNARRFIGIISRCPDRVLGFDKTTRTIS
jgi:hypothetical protein